MFQIETFRVSMWVVSTLATVFTLGILIVAFLARLRLWGWMRPTDPSPLSVELKDLYREVHEDTLRQADGENPDAPTWLKDSETADEHWTLFRIRLYNDASNAPRWLQELASHSGSINQTAVEVLIRLENKDPDTLRWLQCRMIEDESEEGRQAALEILLRRWATARGRALLSRDLDGLKPFLDPREPLPQGQIRKAAEYWGCAQDEVQVQLEDLKELLGWDPRFGAQVGGRHAHDPQPGR